MNASANDPLQPPVREPKPPHEEFGAAAEAPTSDEKLWALLSHLSYFVLGVFGPLIVWLVKKEDSAFVEDQAKEALNFQLSVLIVSLACAGTCILIPLTILVAIGGIVYSVLAAVESSKGVRYRYPYTFRMVK